MCVHLSLYLWWALIPLVILQQVIADRRCLLTINPLLLASHVKWQVLVAVRWFLVVLLDHVLFILTQSRIDLHLFEWWVRFQELFGRYGSISVVVDILDGWHIVIKSLMLAWSFGTTVTRLFELRASRPYWAQTCLGIVCHALFGGTPPIKTLGRVI